MTHLSRRSVVAAVSGGVALLLLDPLPVGAAPALGRTNPPPSPIGRLLLTGDQPLPFRRYTADFSTRLDASYMAAARLSTPTTVPAGARATLTYDPRIFEPTAAIVVGHGPVMKVSPSIQDASGTTGSLEFTIDREVGSGDESLLLVMPLNFRPLYPNENLGSMTPTTLTITSESTSDPATLILTEDTASDASAPWGIDVTGVWADAPIVNRNRQRSYRYPALVHITSVGPSATPAGCVLTVNVDASIVGSTSVTSVTRGDEIVSPSRYATATSVNGGARSLEVTFVDEIEPGVSIQVSLDSILLNPLGSSDSVTVARASFSGADTDARPQRKTTGETFIDVTSSGTATTADSTVGGV